MTAPLRRTVRLAHLGAHIVPVEQALLIRAAQLEDEAADPQPTPAGQPDRTPGVLAIIADEFRALAGELHYWG